MTQLLHRGERGNPVTEAGDGETPTEQLMAGPAGLSLIAALMAAVVRWSAAPVWEKAPKEKQQVWVWGGGYLPQFGGKDEQAGSEPSRYHRK